MEKARYGAERCEADSTPPVITCCCDRRFWFHLRIRDARDVANQACYDLFCFFFQRIHFSREKIPTKRKHDRAEVRPHDHTLRNSNELPLCHYRTKTLFVSSEILDIYTDRCCGSFPAICSRIAPLCLLFGLDYFFTKKSLAVWVDVADFFFGVIPMR